MNSVQTLLAILLCASVSVPLCAAERLKILALGDSYTIGEGVKQEEIWPIVLGAKLRPNGPPPAVNVIAKTGWTSGFLIRALDAVKPAPEFDLVTLLIGVNNQFQGREAKEFREQFVELLGRARELAKKKPRRVVVVSIPDYSVTPFCEGRDRAKIAKELGAFNAICKEEAAKAGVHYVDITPGSRDAATNKELLAADGLHPSGKMYAQWAANVFEAVKAEFAP